MREKSDDEPTFGTLVDRLTSDHLEWLDRDTGRELATSTALLAQLREAIFLGMGNSGGSSAFGSKPPIDATAVDLLDEITEQAAQALAAVTHKPTPYGHAESYVRLWSAGVNEDTLVSVSSRATVDRPDPKGKIPSVYDEISQYTAYALVKRWVSRIEDYFDPPSTREIAAACPTCGERHIHKFKDGHTTRSAALVFIRDKITRESTEARCLVCGRSWLPDQFVFLANLVGAKPLPELADTP